MPIKRRVLQPAIAFRSGGNGIRSLFADMGRMPPFPGSVPRREHGFNLLKADLRLLMEAFAAAHPDIVAKLQALIAANEADLGSEGIAPGCRELGRAENPKPLIPHDGK